MDKNAVIVLRGVLNYAKVLGKARPHTGLPKYDKGPYWSLDLTPDAKSLALMEKFGITEKLKDPSPKDKARVGNEKYLSLRVLENRSDGEKNSPPRVVDASGNAWDNGNIGNGSVGDVRVKVVDYGRASEKGVYLQALRVLKHVPYESAEFEPLSEDDEYFGSPEDDQEVTADEVEDEDLDDDVPF